MYQYIHWCISIYTPMYQYIYTVYILYIDSHCGCWNDTLYSDSHCDYWNDTLYIDLHCGCWSDTLYTDLHCGYRNDTLYIDLHCGWLKWDAVHWLTLWLLTSIMLTAASLCGSTNSTNEKFNIVSCSILLEVKTITSQLTASIWEFMMNRKLKRYRPHRHLNLMSQTLKHRCGVSLSLHDKEAGPSLPFSDCTFTHSASWIFAVLWATPCSLLPALCFECGPPTQSSLCL